MVMQVLAKLKTVDQLRESLAHQLIQVDTLVNNTEFVALRGFLKLTD